MATILADIRQASTAPRLASVGDYLAPESEPPLLRVTTAGSVDDGKSTLIGRLLHDANSIPDDQLESLRNSRINRSSGPLDFSLLTDGLKAEREQGITIDVAYRHFASPRRRFLLADAPGHEQYTRNMATAASTADAAIVLLDARHGLTAQSRRHAYLAWAFGVRRLVVAVNKMDLVGFDPAVFDGIRAAWEELGKDLDGARFDVLPVSALLGDNVTTRSERTPWYGGPCLLEALEAIDAPAWDTDAPLRMAVQCVIRPDLGFRGYAGRIDSGCVRVGQRVQTLPSGRTTRVARIVTFDGDLEEAFAPMAVTLVLQDELDISRGDWICGEFDPPAVASHIEATVTWMHEHPLGVGERLLLQHGASRVPATVLEIVRRIDPVTFRAQPATQLTLNEVAVLRLETTRRLVFDPYCENRQTGAFILIDPVDNHTLAAGMIRSTAASASPRIGLEIAVTPVERAMRYGHEPAVVVSSSARVLFGLQRALFEKGAIATLLRDRPGLELLRDLLANGLIVLMPPCRALEIDGVAWVECEGGGSPRDIVDAALRKLELRGVLLRRDFVSMGEGI
jgi:sulfate adenylyltransferase large subunit